MNNQYFQTLLTKRGRFLNGENPSPAKLSAINAQIESAFAVIESFLGNGTDYLITSDSNRRLLPNISSAMGLGEKIYKPVNAFHSLEQVARKYLNNPSAYNSATGELTLGANTTINIHIPEGNIVGIYYKTNSNNTVTLVQGSTNYTFPASVGKYSWAYSTVSEGPEDTISIAVTGGLVLKSLVVSNVTDGISPIMNVNTTNLINASRITTNVAYSIPLSNNSYFSVKTPCYYANPTRQGTSDDPRCTSKSCDYCIGNSYDLSTPGSSGYGAPACIGAVLSNGASGHYQADVTTNKTFQSPLLTVDNPYSAKYMPFRMHSGVAAGVQLPSNSLILYDTSNKSIPVVQGINFYAASANRGDIVFTKDQLDISNTTKQYLLIGGNYGMSNMLWDILGLVKGY